MWLIDGTVMLYLTISGTSNVVRNQLLMLCVSSQRVISRDGNILSKTSGMQSGGEEEQDEDAHTPLPPRMKIINDPSDPDDKVIRPSRVFPLRLGSQTGCCRSGLGQPVITQVLPVGNMLLLTLMVYSDQLDLLKV